MLPSLLALAQLCCCCFVWLYMRRHGSVGVRSAQSGSACAHQDFCHQPQKKALSTKDKKKGVYEREDSVFPTQKLSFCSHCVVKDAILSNLYWSQKSLELPSTSYGVSLKKAYQMSAVNLCPALISNMQSNSFRDLCFICSYMNATLPDQTAAVQQRAKQGKSLLSACGGSYWGWRGWGSREVEKYLKRDVARPSWEKG